MKLLFLTSRMGLGGAETHILGLATALVRQGHEVTVASAGGRLAEALPPVVRHHRLPLDKKDPLSLLRSLFGIVRLVRREGIDLLHAHARIPAVLCHGISRWLGIPFVTTVHLDFPRKGLGRFSRFGERTLAVSQDIKDHLIACYGLPPDTVSVTVNGIDTEHFAPASAATSSPSLRLLHVSRLDRDRSGTAGRLITLTPRLRERFPALRITVVGEGEDLPSLRAQARAIDPKEETLRLVGGVTDPLPYLQDADLFLGVSRAALEAMACGLPVVLAGDQGYGGILTPETLERAAATNLCCRGELLPTEEALLRDLSVLLSDGERRRTLGVFGREAVLQRYPFSRTAEDCLRLYRSLTPHPKRRRGGVLLGGYFGAGNTGDEAILTVLLQELRQEDPHRPLTVISSHPRRTAHTHGVVAVGRLSPLTLLPALWRADTLLLGGGGLLQDGTSLRSLCYYTALLRLGTLWGKRVILHGGIGPLDRPISRFLVRRTLRGVTVSVRDHRSATLLRELGLGGEIPVVPDPATRLTPADGERVAHLLHRYGLSPGRFAVVAPRKGEGTVFPLPLGLTPLLIPFFPREDLAVCRRLQSYWPGAVLGEKLSPTEIRGLIGASALVLGMRLHALILADGAGVPRLAVGRDPKITAYAPAEGDMPEGPADAVYKKILKFP